MKAKRGTRPVLWALSILLLLPLGASGAAMPPAAPSPSPAVAGVDDVRISPEGRSGLTIELDLPNYRLAMVQRDGVAYQEIQVDAAGWTQAGTPGWPQLPARSLLLAVPPTGEVTLQVLDATPQPVLGRFFLQPAPRPDAIPDLEAWQGPVPLIWQADRTAYAQDRWLPVEPAEITEEGWLRNTRFVRLTLRPFQYNPARGALRAIADLRVRLAFADGEQYTAMPEAADPVFEDILQAAFPNYRQAAPWRSRPAATPMPANARAHLAQPWVKVTVDSDGVYRFTYEDLLAAGIDQSELDALDPRTFRLLDQGQEQAVYLFGQANGSFDPAEYLLFYGQRDTEPFTDDRNVYWLTWGGDNGLRMETQEGAPGAAPSAPTLLTTLHVESNLKHVLQRPWEHWLADVQHDHWYWTKLSIDQPYTVTVDANLTAVDTASAVSPTLTMQTIGDYLYGGSYQVHGDVNTQADFTSSWYSTNFQVITQTLPAGILVDERNYVALTAQDINGVPGVETNLWLDWLRLTYPYSGRYLADAVFYNPEPGTWRYQITDLPVSTAWILNLADPARPQRVVNATPASKSGLATLTWELTTTAADRFLVTPDNKVRAPVAIEPYTPTDLLDPHQQVDYLVISHSDFITAVQPLVDAHVADGLTVRVVDTQEIYDEFSDGSLSAEAIRDYLSYAYSNYRWPAPTYALLVGDGTKDFRGYQYAAGTVHNANLLPPFVGGFDPLGGGFGLTDSAFGFLQGDDVLPEMLIGRLPVNDVAETQVVVAKTLGYMSDTPDGWSLETLWVADNTDAGGDFHQASDETIAYLTPDFHANRIYYCDPVLNAPCPDDPWIYSDVGATRQAILDSISDGQLLINWSGHGGAGAWAHEWLFIHRWTEQLTNGNRLGFTVISACATADFTRYEGHGMEERLIRYADGGIVGGFAPTTFDILRSQTVLIKHFYDALMRLRLTEVGVAAAVARARAYADIQYPYGAYTAVGHMIMGDPALHLLQPDADCTAGDLDCDSDFDTVDVQVVASAWNSYPWDEHYIPSADLDGNRHVTIDDLITAAGRWGQPVR